MANKNSRSAKILMLSGAMDNNNHGKEDILSPHKTTHKNKICNTIALRPRYKYPSYAPTNTSKDDSLDESINNRNRDETYIPTEDEYFDDTTATDTAEMSSVFFNNTDNCNNNEVYEQNYDSYINTSLGIDTDKNRSVESSYIANENIINCITTEEDYNIVTTEFDSEYLMAIGQQISRDPIQKSTNILADDSDTSIIENSQPSTTIPVEPTATSSRANCVPHSDCPDSSNSTISEINDSDRDVTFHPTSNESSSESSANEEPVDAPSEAESPTRQRRQGIKQHLARNNDKEDLINSTKTSEIPRTRIKDFCYFCETNVLNFARHVIRNHTLEPEVQKILSYPIKSYTRKNLLTALRKKGNYIANVHKCVKPMKKSNIYPDIDYLPCEKCLGFYSRKQLWKHKKKCQPSSLTSNAQVDAQNFMLRNLNVDKKLKNEVFPKMRPDRVSLEAKKDTLICAYGAQYLRIHREKHFINVTSRKMRELAKVLIELKKLKPSIKNLTDCLKPQNYDLIVHAAKIISSYDNKSDRYGAPTYAMNISTSLKQCCNIAIMATLKSGHSEQTSQMEADFKTLIHIIEANWKYDVSSQACNDLNLKKWNKVTVVPLASDLKILKEHLCKEAKIAASKLTHSDASDVEAYNTLLETIFCRVILLNRRRPGELQRLLLSTYQECRNDDNAYEEFDRAISNAEKLLMKSFKRIVIRGKRGRGVPVLFTDDVQTDINLLINIRNKYIHVENNYLFAKPGCVTSLCGYKVLDKYAKSCGAKNPKAITATKLRKHLATLTQMLNLKDSDIEQLANFMGHTQSVHRQNYRLPDDVYQTAKISKLLLLMEGGNADIHKGKSLDEIELDLDQDLLQENADENNDCNEFDYDDAISTEQAPEINITDTASNIQEVSLKDVTNMTKITSNKKRTLVPWTTQQKKLVTTFFNKHIKSKRPPKRHECEELRSQHPEIFKNKNWLKIKVFIQNIYSKKI